MHVDQIGFIKERISLDQLLVKAAFQVAKFLFKRGSILGTVNSNSKSLHEFSNATGIENNNKKEKKHWPIEITIRAYSLDIVFLQRSSNLRGTIKNN